MVRGVEAYSKQLVPVRWSKSVLGGSCACTRVVHLDTARSTGICAMLTCGETPLSRCVGNVSNIEIAAVAPYH